MQHQADEERGHAAKSAGALLEWHRVDQSTRIRRVLASGAAILTSGGVIVAGAFLTRQSEELRRWAAILGIALTILGAVWTVIGVMRALAEERYLALRADGVLVKGADDAAFYAWDEIVAIAYDEGRMAIILELVDRPAIVFDAPLGGAAGEATPTSKAKDIAKRFEQARRRAALGLHQV